jgi:hypothetical protein
MAWRFEAWTTCAASPVRSSSDQPLLLLLLRRPRPASSVFSRAMPFLPPLGYYLSAYLQGLSARPCWAVGNIKWTSSLARLAADQLRDQRGQGPRMYVATVRSRGELGWDGCGPGAGPTWPLGRWVRWPVTPTGTGAGSSVPAPYRRLPAGGSFFKQFSQSAQILCRFRLALQRKSGPRVALPAHRLYYTVDMWHRPTTRGFCERQDNESDGGHNASDTGEGPRQHRDTGGRCQQGHKTTRHAHGNWGRTHMHGSRTRPTQQRRHLEQVHQANE